MFDSFNVEESEFTNLEFNFQDNKIDVSSKDNSRVGAAINDQLEASFCEECGKVGSAVAAIQFDCGGCCKKVLAFDKSACLDLDFCNGTVFLSAEQLLLKAFSGGQLVEKQCLEKIKIALDHLCSIEFNVVELDPNVFVGTGLSKIAVQFECGKCCKKVLNVKKAIEFGGFVFLVPPAKECLLIKTFNKGKLVDKQLAKVIIIPKNRICSVEYNAIEVDP